MYKVLAISGGIDSVAMLHMMRFDPKTIVAHFNHGIRENADQDQIFVKNLAKSYNLPFITKKENLGSNCSEAHARARRYEFLNAICKKYQGKIYTAHHQDDLIETIAINLVRGTGWRGLAPLNDPKIHRPLIKMTKNDIYHYAAKHQLIWHHDYTNTENRYLRSRIRPLIFALSTEQKTQLIALCTKQKTLKHDIDQSLKQLLPKNNIYERKWFATLDDKAATEILRAALEETNRAATRPQLTNFLSAIRTYAPNKKFNLEKNYLITFNSKTFMLQ